jgi:hypothetical protein
MVTFRAARCSRLTALASMAVLFTMGACNSIFGVSSGVPLDGTTDGYDADDNTDTVDDTIDADPTDAPVVDAAVDVLDAMSCGDEDADSVPDEFDGCPTIPSAPINDNDGDGIPDACDVNMIRQRRVVFEGWSCPPDSRWGLLGWSHGGGELSPSSTSPSATFGPLGNKSTYVAATFSTTAAAAAIVSITGPSVAVKCSVSRSEFDTFIVGSIVCPMNVCTSGPDETFATPDGLIKLEVTVDLAAKSVTCTANGISSMVSAGPGPGWVLDGLTLERSTPKVSFPPNLHLLVLQDE